MEYGCFRVDKLCILAIPVEGAKDILVWETGNSSQTGTEEGRIAARNAFRNAIFVVDVCKKIIVTNKFDKIHDIRFISFTRLLFTNQDSI